MHSKACFGSAASPQLASHIPCESIAGISLAYSDLRTCKVSGHTALLRVFRTVC
eukprot:NODE_4758_length_629_cov_89.834483_g2083_i1.p3 GENE.NODE_4758_length_629_cov_89.834483_g2083_i1~~NODE_4758_length_629_cov_89.834483_g2083_i1.p3  ORF type:complete len:54 (-),score=4.26 NODE_4758_length_629_cov_89.834483_g2083_i1:165-326(-)